MAPEGVCGGNRGTPAGSGKAQPPVRESPTFSGEERDVNGNPSGSPCVQRFLLGVERWARRAPGDAGPPAHPRLLQGCSHMARVFAPTPHRHGGGKVGDAGVLQARSRASRGCSGSTPEVSPSSCAHVPSAHPHSRVPVLSPAAEVASQKEEAPPPASPTIARGLFWVWRKEEGSTGREMPCSTQGPVVNGEWGKRNPNIAPHLPSHVWDGERGSVSPEA